MVRILQVHTRYRKPRGEDIGVGAEARVLREASHEVRQVIEINPDMDAHTTANLLLSLWSRYPRGEEWAFESCNPRFVTAALKRYRDGEWCDLSRTRRTLKCSSDESSAPDCPGAIHDLCGVAGFRGHSETDP